MRVINYDAKGEIVWRSRKVGRKDGIRQKLTKRMRVDKKDESG